MKKLIGWAIGGGFKKLLDWVVNNIYLLLILAAVLFGVWVNALYNRAGRLSEAVATQERLILKKDSLMAVVRSAHELELKIKDQVILDIRAGCSADSAMYNGMIVDVQRTLLEIRKDRDYWKDWAEKLESGEFCVEWYGLFKKKKRLVRCVE
jgi:hypothetical protein